jgi:hypothetical protein
MRVGQGRLAERWNLIGAVATEHFARLSEGQHPHTEEQLVRHQVSRTYEGKFGREVTSAEHRAGWDATFSAPKSVSLTARNQGHFTNYGPRSPLGSVSDMAIYRQLQLTATE